MSGTGRALLSKIFSIFNHLSSHEGFKRYFANTSWLFAEKVLRMVVGLFVGVWVARYLGPEKYGLLSYAQSFVGLFTAIATLGLDGIVVRELVKDESRRDELLGTAFWLKVIGGIGVLVFVALAVNFTSNDWYTNFIIFVIASGTVFQAFNVVDMYFQAKVMGKYIAYVNALSLFAGSLFKIYLILSEAPLVYFAWAVVFDSVVLALGYVYFYVFTKGSFRSFLHFRKSTAISLLKDSWPVILSGILLMIQARIDQVMIQEMVGSIEVGYYSVALRLIETFGFIPMILNSSIFPALVNAKKISQTLYNERFLNYYRLSFLLFLLTAIPIFLASEKIVVALYGFAYQPSGVLLSLMAVRLFFANTGVARGAFINIENLFRFSLFTMASGTLINVFLNYYLIPSYKSQGAIFATIVSFSITTFLIDFIYSKTRENVKLQMKAIFTFYKLNLRS
ncbi:flippase [Candidatus Kryptobacter tengchongensis]|uniref:flippase n=1 Tax=Kryptobacter tengchongensis TaxID=1643429 RepID=UPI000707F81E|nr:flippase [Candidatus Kryptobacter tengchongensis]CUS92988.1 Membrane protein involved in the export of O-antigen and teichoic acid [Candidatus Kryptobacter tengchongensis]